MFFFSGDLHGEPEIPSTHGLAQPAQFGPLTPTSRGQILRAGVAEKIQALIPLLRKTGSSNDKGNEEWKRRVYVLERWICPFSAG